MTEEEVHTLLENTKDFFREKILKAHIDKGIKSASKLSSYNVNPFLYKYLANFLRGNDNPRSIAEALIYPRILGSSITTSFGMNIQKSISELFQGLGSAIPGIDIEFIDGIDGRKKYCQLKSGPNTINHDDIETIVRHFKSIKNIARTNNLQLQTNDLIIGVIYGEPETLSSHYQKLDQNYPVYVGKDFWHRLTGKENFYSTLIDAIGTIALETDASHLLEEAINKLAQQIKSSIS